VTSRSTELEPSESRRTGELGVQGSVEPHERCAQKTVAADSLHDELGH